MNALGCIAWLDASGGTTLLLAAQLWPELAAKNAYEAILKSALSGIECVFRNAAQIIVIKVCQTSLPIALLLEL